MESEKGSVKLSCCFFLILQHQTLSGGGPAVVSVLRQADAEPGRTERFSGVLADRVQRGEHAVLVGLRRPQTGNQQERRQGESTLHL